MTTYCLLASDGTVNATFANSQLPTSQAGYNELPVDGGQLGQVWNGTAFTAGPTPVPQSVSGIQLRMAVMASAQAATIAAFVNAQSAAIQMAYNTTDVFNRTDALLAGIVTAGVLTSAQVDALFITAAATTT